MNVIKPSRMTTSITLFLLDIFPFSRLCGAIYQNYGDFLIFIRFLSIALLWLAMLQNGLYLLLSN